jgi:hypothetical protein
MARRCHHQVSRIVLDAVLRSNASTDSGTRLRLEDLSKLINNAIDAAHYEQALQRMLAVNGTSLARLELKRFLAQLGQVQIAPFENHPATIAGRAVGLLENITRRRRSEIEDRVAGASPVLDLPARQAVGISISDAAKVYFLILKHYADLWAHVDRRLSREEKRVTEALGELDQLALQNYGSSGFRVGE